MKRLMSSSTCVWLTLAFSCGARTASELKERDCLRTTLSRRQLQGFVRRRVERKPNDWLGCDLL